MRRSIALLVLAVTVLVAACTPSAAIAERTSAQRLANELGIGPVECEDATPHPNPNLPDTFIVYCERDNGGTDWALVDSAVTYRSGHTRATSTAITWHQEGSKLRSHKQTCEWAGSGFDWRATSCTAPVLVSIFPLG